MRSPYYDYTSKLKAGDRVKVRTTRGLDIPEAQMGAFGNVQDSSRHNKNPRVLRVKLDDGSLHWFTRDQLSEKNWTLTASVDPVTTAESIDPTE
jgi:hypothetical protein